ncbi:DUF1707 domain-containing protein [Kibdelosporangium lantanae]
MSDDHVLASDDERREVAHLVQTAGGEGRLTLTETDERLAAVYAARYRHELAGLTTDLPVASPPRPVRRHRPLGVHAAVVVLVSALLVVRWVASGVPFFWPAFPVAWLVASLVIHTRVDWRRRLVSR